MVAPDNLMESSKESAVTKGNTENQGATVSNGNEIPPTEEDVKSKSGEEDEGGRKPSYVSLACCISGYTTLHYDSRVRPGIRSPSPINLSKAATNGNQNTVYKSECGNYLSPHPPELTSKTSPDVKGAEMMNGCQNHSSPSHITKMSLTSESRRNFTSSMLTENYTCSSASGTSSHYSSYSQSLITSPSSKTEYINGGSRLIPAVKAPTQVSPSSFIVQRVERLYGPGALAQGFYSPRRLTTPSKETKITCSEKSDEEVNNSLPVLKLLRPEFRAQLNVASRKSKSPESKSENLNSNDKTSERPTLHSKATDSVDATTIIISKTKDLNISDVKDGHYFLKLLDGKVVELEKLAETAERALADCPNEEGAGVLRAISGKARLLVAEKLNQFRGLCNKNLKQTDDEDFPTTCEDLAGFWDMVLIQVRAVLSQYDDIEELKKNNWEPVTPKAKTETALNSGRAQRKLVPRKLNTESTSAASKARDEARRKMIEERRKAMKNMKQDDTVILV